MARVELIVFDFDGTLVDTAPDLIRATNRYLETKGLPALAPNRIREAIGFGLKHLIAEVYPKERNTPAFLQQIYEEFVGIYEQEYLRSPRLFDGAREFLNDWAGQIAIVSNKRERFIHPILGQLGIERLPWAAIVGGDTFANMKPHPEPFLAAMQAANVNPEQTLILGDGVPDVTGAMAVGAKAVAVEFGYTPARQLLDLGAWKSLRSFYELSALIGSIT